VQHPHIESCLQYDIKKIAEVVRSLL
jgi:hypothetical protein